MISNCSKLHYIFTSMPNIVLTRQCGLDPQSPDRKKTFSYIGDDGYSSAMTVKVLGLCPIVESLLCKLYLHIYLIVRGDAAP